MSPTLKHHFEGESTKEIKQTDSATKWCVYGTIKRYKVTGTIVVKSGSGRPRTAQKLNKIVRERVRRNPVRSIRKITKELNIPSRSMGKLVKEVILAMKCDKFLQFQFLSELIGIGGWRNS